MQKNEKGFYFKRNRDMAGYNLTSRREVVQEVVDPVRAGDPRDAGDEMEAWWCSQLEIQWKSSW